MGLLSFLATTALLFLGSTGLLETTSLTPVQAQTLSAPLVPTDNLNVPLYIYNSESAAIVSPAASGNGLTMVPWQYYDNNTMQWVITEVEAENYYTISALSATSAGCAAGTTAEWDANKKAPVTTLCSPATSLFTNFVFVVDTSAADTYYIVPNSNSLACVTIVNDVPTSPGNSCTRSVLTQWQFVTISP